MKKTIEPTKKGFICKIDGKEKGRLEMSTDGKDDCYIKKEKTEKIWTWDNKKNKLVEQVRFTVY